MDWRRIMARSRWISAASERACALSHRKAWRHFLASGAERCLILEDDVLLSPQLPAFLRDAARMPPEVGLLRLETRFMRTRLGPGRRCHLRGFRVHELFSTHYGAAAYVMTRAFAVAAARDLVDFTEPVDHVLFGAAEVCFYPAIAHQLRPALCVQAELVERVQHAPFARSDLELQRRARLDRQAGALPVQPVKGRRSIAVKCLLEVRRWGRKAAAMREWGHERLVARRTWQDIAFCGPILPVAATALSVPGGEQALQPQVPTL